MLVAADYRQVRIEQLLESQNPDGGWGYFPRRQSWLEPTCFAMLAVEGSPEAKQASARAWGLIRSWQLADGGFAPTAAVHTACWATSLAVTLHCRLNQYDAAFEKALRWVTLARGAEGDWFERAVNLVYRLPVEYDRRYKGWPWCPDSASWVEPTAHSLVALKLAGTRSKEGAARIEEAERMLLDRRSQDGGWNYGNRRVRNADLPSYPETTGVALLGLQGCRLADLRPSLSVARRHLDQTKSPLARAWLSICLRNYGHALPVPDGSSPGTDLLVTALEAMACPNGGHQWLKTA